MRQLRLSFIPVLLATFFLHVEKTEADNEQTYEVDANILHVRSAPEGNAEIIGVLQQGDKLAAFQEKYGWVQTYYYGEEAWVARHYLVPIDRISQPPAPEAAPAPTGDIIVTAPSVHIRSGPGLDYPVIGGTVQGEQFESIAMSGEWIHISLADGNTGWIASWLTDAVHAESPPQVSDTMTEQQQESGTLFGYTIVLDAGHGGKDPGALGSDRLYEKDLAYETTRKIGQALRANGATVIETRTGDYYLPLDDRIQISNSYATDAFISVHYNSFPSVSAQGINTFYSSEAGNHLANHVHPNIASAVPLADRGLHHADYKVLRETKAPAILLELGFVSNDSDLSVIQTADYQQKAAEAIAAGLIQYFN